MEICLRLAEGEGLVQICRSEHIPSVGTVLKWVFTDHEGFLNRYTRARAMQAELRADELIEIADTPQMGVIVTETMRGTETKHCDMIEHRRLRIETRKWIAAKLLPKKYGTEPVPPPSGESESPAVVIQGGLPD